MIKIRTFIPQETPFPPFKIVILCKLEVFISSFLSLYNFAGYKLKNYANDSAQCLFKVLNMKTE